jgi:hypothetical protein
LQIAARLQKCDRNNAQHRQRLKYTLLQRVAFKISADSERGKNKSQNGEY